MWRMQKFAKMQTFETVGCSGAQVAKKGKVNWNKIKLATSLEDMLVRNSAFRVTELIQDFFVSSECWRPCIVLVYVSATRWKRIDGIGKCKVDTWGGGGGAHIWKSQVSLSAKAWLPFLAVNLSAKHIKVKMVSLSFNSVVFVANSLQRARATKCIPFTFRFASPQWNYLFSFLLFCLFSTVAGEFLFFFCQIRFSTVAGEIFFFLLSDSSLHSGWWFFFFCFQNRFSTVAGEIFLFSFFFCQIRLSTVAGEIFFLSFFFLSVLHGSC